MRLHRFFTDVDISKKTVLLTEKDTIHQIMHVLRLTKGDEIILCDTKGYDVQVRMMAVSKKSIEGEIVSFKKNIAEPERYVTLYCGILKKENFEMVVQKAVEAGVSEIFPLKTKRTVKTGLSKVRLEKIAKEAVEQCGRARIPLIHEPMVFFDVIPHVMRNPEIHLNILFDSSGEDAMHFFQKNKNDARINIFVGPEGGWDVDELKAAQESGFHILSLGSRTLRAETAAIVGTFLAVSL